MKERKKKKEKEKGKRYFIHQNTFISTRLKISEKDILFTQIHFFPPNST
tara:strand:- start:333 stop:479 length:147 start_codon:yes stop_codon:yes gene_type:complete